jgi:hypothetical protein
MGKLVKLALLAGIAYLVWSRLQAKNGTAEVPS